MKTPRIVPSVAIALALTLLMAASARAQSPFPPRDGALAVDASIEISGERLRREYEERLGGLGDLDGLMLVVPSCQPDPEVYLDEALQHYGMAPGPGEMYDDAVVWLVCYDPRFVGIYYSKENRLAAAFDQADVSNAVAGSMGENLANGNLTGALVVGIEGLAAAAPTAPGDQSAAGGSAPGRRCPRRRRRGDGGRRKLALAHRPLAGPGRLRPGRPVALAA